MMIAVARWNEKWLKFVCSDHFFSFFWLMIRIKWMLFFAFLSHFSFHLMIGIKTNGIYQFMRHNASIFFGALKNDGRLITLTLLQLSMENMPIEFINTSNQHSFRSFGIKYLEAISVMNCVEWWDRWTIEMERETRVRWKSIVFHWKDQKRGSQDTIATRDIQWIDFLTRDSRHHTHVIHVLVSCGFVLRKSI